MGLENSSHSKIDLPKRRLLVGATLLGVAASLGINTLVHAYPTEDTAPGRLICGATVRKPSKKEVETATGMQMSTLHDYYEEYVPDQSCGLDTGGEFDIRLKSGAVPVPAMLYPGILKNFPRRWSEESREILYELARRMPGYYTPDHLTKPALLVLSTGDAVDTPQAPHNQGVVTFGPKTMRYKNIKNAARIYTHEGAHLWDPMVVAEGSDGQCICMTGEIEGPDPDNCLDPKNPVPDIKESLIKSPLHDSMYRIFEGSSFKNPPQVMKEWADLEFEKLRVAGRLGSADGPYDPMERWVYGIRQKFPVELIGVASEFLMQNGPDYDFLMEAARPLVEIGVFQEAQIRSLRNLIVNEGPLKGVDTTALRCIFI